MRISKILATFFFLCAWFRLHSQDPPVAAKSPQDVAKAARPSVVVIAGSGRTPDAHSSGSGFLIRSSGILATNLHVIGEGRPFDVILADQTRLVPKAILAFDRAKDLAIVQVAGEGLPALELGDSDALQPGQSAVAVGNPLGLGLSAASGAFAEMREIEGRKLLQVAIPIEPGSSGSPLLDMSGKVIGVIAIKGGASTAFAVPVNDLKLLLENQRPVPIERWLTIGALDSKVWRPLLGGQWRQRAGRMVATGAGDGFGGRMICLSVEEPPAPDFDLAVEVKLEDESGAAGLAFCSDGSNKHYGFYPTNGSLRLTRFEGPDVFSWTILKTVDSSRYSPGDWNSLRVRVRGPKITCTLNGSVVIELEDEGLRGGKAGLVKFRTPSAELRGFRCAAEIPDEMPSAELDSKVDDLAGRLSGAGVDAEILEQAAALGDSGLRALLDRAKKLDDQARKLRGLADRARRHAVLGQLERTLDKEGEGSLLEAALLVSKLDNADLDVASYVSLVDRMAQDATEALSGRATEMERLEGMLKRMFEDLAFRGSNMDYYHRSNSYLNEVLDDREGIPITLSIVFMELGRRAGLKLVGIGLPRHFVVEHRPAEGDRQLVDVFGGRLITRAQAEVLCGVPLDDSAFAPSTHRQIVVRMLHNLMGTAQRSGDIESMLRSLDAIVRLERDPEAIGSARYSRGALRFQTGDLEGARTDVDWLLEHGLPAGVSREDVEELGRLSRSRDR